MHFRNFVLSIFILIVTTPISSYAEYHGRFENKVVGVWLVEEGPDRNMRLMEDFFYYDPNGKRWPAPRGSIINGASIPWLLWNKWIGPPYVGNYRRASVVHDVACELREKICKSSEIAHRMFYDACRCGGVGDKKAKVMYWAVRNFGPKWGIQEPEKVLTPKQSFELKEIDEFIKSTGLTVDSSADEINRILAD
jgi:hypothetical protein